MEKQAMVLLTTDDVMEMFSISRVTLWRWVKAGILPQPLNMPGCKKLLWVKSDIEASIEQMRRNAA